jgi:hypothetical protein
MGSRWICCLWLAGCSPGGGFEHAVPDRSLLTLKVPGDVSAAGTSSLSQGLLGERATFYTVTVTTTSNFNNGVAGFLDGIEHILTQPPSQQSATHAVWGPTNDPLATANYKFDVERAAPDAYGYGFSGKLKGAPDSAFQLVIEGENHIVDASHATGNLHVDSDLARMLDPNNLSDQNYFVHYDNTGSQRIVAIAFQKAGSNDAGYQYAQNPDGSGSFQFASLQDVDGDGTLETLGINSRWLATGAGRADVAAEGGSLAAPQGMTECWDASFGRTFFQQNGHLVEGDPQSCAF